MDKNILLDDKKMQDIAKDYKSYILSYIHNIYDNNIKINEEMLTKYALNMILISTKGNYYNELIDEFLKLPREYVRECLNRNIDIRERLNKRLGIDKSYDFEGRIGDHGICSSRDFDVKMLDNLDKINVTPDEFKKISDNWLSDIIHMIKQNPDLNVYFEYKQEKTSDEELIKNYNDFLDGKEILNMENKIILQEMSNLMLTYDIPALLNKDERIENEIKSGLYDFIKQPTPRLSSFEREKIYCLKDIWNRQDIENYSNLELLLKRYESLLRYNKDNKKLSKIILKLRDKVKQGEKSLDRGIKLKREMEKFYSYYDRVNKDSIVNLVYSPNISRNIERKSDVPESLLLHFYNPDVNLEKIFDLVAVNRCRVSNGEEPIIAENMFDLFRNEDIDKKLNYDKERFKDYLESIDVKSLAEELLPGKTFEFKDDDIKVPRQEVLETASKQLACYLINKESVLEFLEHNRNLSSGSGNVAFAVGFSKKVINGDNIILSCDENANSNIGYKNIPCKNRFASLSKTYDELMKVKNKRTEVLLNRDGISADYLFVLRGKITEHEKELIERETAKAKSFGLKVLTCDIEEINKESKDKFKTNLKNNINSTPIVFTEDTLDNKVRKREEKTI